MATNYNNKEDRKRTPFPYKQSYCKDLIEHMTLGKSFASFGGVISCTRFTLEYWLEKYDEFYEAREIGTLKSLLYWEDIGEQIIKGLIKGNAAVWFGVMYNRFYQEYKTEAVIMKMIESQKSSEEIQKQIAEKENLLKNIFNPYSTTNKIGTQRESGEAKDLKKAKAKIKKKGK